MADRRGPETEATFLLRMSQSQRRQLTELADEAGVTVRAFLMHRVFDAPLSGIDRRPGRRRPASDQPPLIEGGHAA